MKYFVQGKNGTSSGWETLSRTDNIKVASQRCRQAMKQKRGKSGTEWYKTRVAVFNDGKFTKVDLIQ